MAYKQKSNPFKKTTGRFVKAPGQVSRPAGASAGQGYLDQLTAERRRDREQKADMPAVNVTPSMESSRESSKYRGGISEAKQGNRDLSKPTFGNVLEDFQGGELTRRQKRLIRRGRQDKARNVGGRRRRRTLKRGGEVSKSISKSNRKGEYRRSSRVVSQDDKGKKSTRRVESGGGSYNYKEKNKAKSATGGAYDLRAARKARRAKRNRA